MSKTSGVRISFAGLRTDQNKQNQITFQNLKSHSPTHSCGSYHHSNINKQQQFGNYRNQCNDASNHVYGDRELYKYRQKFSNTLKFNDCSFREFYDLELQEHSQNFNSTEIFVSSPFTQYKSERIIPSSSHNQNTYSIHTHTKNGELGLQCSTSSKFADIIRQKQLSKSRKRARHQQNPSKYQSIISPQSSLISSSCQSPNTSGSINPKIINMTIATNTNTNTNKNTRNATCHSPNYGHSKPPTQQQQYNIHQRLLEQSYVQAQNSINLQIQQYNAKYAQVAEILADLHIKDLMKFNQMLQKNQAIYKKYLSKENSYHQHQHQNYNNEFNQDEANQSNSNSVNFYQLSFEDSKKIYEVERALVKIMSQRTKSFDFMSTNESRNNKRVSAQSQIAKNNLFDPKIIKKNSQRLQKLTDSLTQKLHKNNLIQSNHSKLSQNSAIQKIKCPKQSQKIKNNYLSNREIKIPSNQQNKSTRREREKDQSKDLEDTPQSVKSKISFTTKMKTQKNLIIGMFDRINVCESIQQNFMAEPTSIARTENQDLDCTKQKQKEKIEKNIENRLKKRRDSQYRSDRYGRSSQE